ncbi:MAG: diacylglycerol kinase, catalytic region [Candidatus Doudnabacteria bacterium]|nr:diacylglycerol kinase, catalytic region [Candidatus Doudnabacteria bacterium]
MYFYILDPHNIPQKNFERQQTELQSLLTEFNVSGEMAKITPLRIIQDLVDTAASRGVKTLIACGTDETFNQMLAAVKDRDFTLGFIPFAPNTQLGRILGMDDLATCVKTIASRRTEKIDLAKIDNNYFISYLELGIGSQTNKPLGMLSSIKLFAGSALTEIKMRIDDAYTITSKTMGGLLVNTRGTKMCAGGAIGNPQDGFLDLLLIEKLSRMSAAKYKKEIENGCYENIPSATSVRCTKVEFLEPINYKISVDGIEVAKFPATVELLPQGLKMIVGKNRTF